MSQPDIDGSERDDDSPYKMSLSLNVLNHLGLNLYSNVPAVLSEAVANAWDADAENVDVDIYPDDGRIEIVDDGHGMDAGDVNERYLRVGYRRRRDEERPNRTPEHGRPVMGRKGIGKLSLLSVAETVDVYTAKDGDRNAFRLELSEIERAIGEEESSSGAPQRQYVPRPLDDFPPGLREGTKLVLSDLTKRIHTTEHALRKRLARRFSILGSEYDFTVRINGEEVTVTDRDYFHKVQFLWTFGDHHYREYCRDSKLEHHEERGGETENGYEISGWIGTVEKPNDLVEDYPGQNTDADDLNKVSLMVRGRMAKPDLLESVNDSRMFTKYLVGEIHADFLDYDDEDDIATSNREDVVKEDPRYQDLLDFLRVELSHIAGKWNDLRNEQESREARKIGAIDMWYESLDPDQRDRAQSLLGKIGRMSLEDESDRRELFKYGVLAFENMKYRDKLEGIDDLSESDERTVSRVLSDLDDVDSSQHHQMLSHRKEAVDAFLSRVEEGGVDDEMHGHLVEHPWLLDPSWEETPVSADIRRGVQRRLREVTGDDGSGVRCVRTAVGFTLVSLRHPTEPAGTGLLELVGTFQRALDVEIEERDRDAQSTNIVFVVPDTDAWNDLEGMLKRQGIVVRKYHDLLEETADTYEARISDDSRAGRVSRLLDQIDDGNVFD
ncbi:Histidine kinase-, DNA gyrase B-, and HSP90-like ATPase [Halogeometricum rufum]|uniref:Histidine kinase-, DNA gyrase B-, and HSP90-like ATPase n=1 Tax=Halogeometricum rufum TaxID=553469 RepID=A0A1I6HG17_9EURY|nr:ATP-binding protein [Halogeometricum rufum]SFR53361.1 Histidine kinase-, DNA gyrase B-, and HSP90-like ATPase [Halogeometricum rufum]